MKPHEAVHLQAEAGIDATAYPKKRYTVWSLRLPYDLGSRLISGVPKEYGVCGTYRPAHFVGRDQIERVTCSHCKSYIAFFVR